MSTNQKSKHSRNHKKHHLHIPHPHLHRHKKSSKDVSTISIPILSSYSEENPALKNLTESQKQTRQVIEQYILSKLEVYSNKSRLWQATHSSHIKRRLRHKAHDIAKHHRVDEDFVINTIDQLFLNVDKYISQLREFTHSISQISNQPNLLFQNVRKSSNQWYALQIERARQIFSDINFEDFTENELLQKYYNHITETLTPKPDLNNTNCIVQLRDQPLNLDQEYEQAESQGKKYLNEMLNRYHKSGIEPDLDIIQQMVNLGLERMKTRPTNEEFESATSFLAKVSVLYKSRQAYEIGLQNMGDDFMLLRFGKLFGQNELSTTKSSKDEFIYLVHLFMKSISYLITLMRTSANDNDEISSTLSTIISNYLSIESNSAIIKLNEKSIFPPKTNIDQWTWLLEKWRNALRIFPIMLTNVGAFGRLLRTTIGIGIARLYNFAETMIATKQSLDSTFINQQLFSALQMGFYFGIAYAIVDCVQDEIRNLNHISSHHLTVLNKNKTSNEQLSTPTEMIDKWLLIMEKLLSGEEYDRKELPKTPLTPLLLETFDSLVVLTKTIDVTRLAFNELALLLRSQRVDKKTPEDFYNDEELFLGAMLKSHFTYTCTTYLGNIKSARDESERLWKMPFLGQLTDDCRDFYDDVTSKSVTSFTHFASWIGRKQQTKKHLLNPFYAFLYLCIDLYEESNYNPETGAFLGRRIIRTLRAIELSAGESALREFLRIFCQENTPLHNYCLNLRTQFSSVSDPEKSFFRSINKSSIDYARTNRKLETYISDNLQRIEDALEIHSLSKYQKTPSISDRDEKLLIAAMNYSITAGGKRLRPLIMMMIADLYNIELKNILPLACAIEYLHTSSLILDDLPAQDNSDLRRGRPTLHKAIINNDIPENLCEGRAQLAAVDLIAVSMSLVNHDLVKNGFSSERVNQVVSEISLSMHDLCIGQMMDLRAARMGIEQDDGQLDELDRIAWLKTGKALEIGLITPAILSISTNEQTQSIELERIRELARLMGILFQMRDDLLDIEGENIGKPIALDVQNNTVTYVSVLGTEGTRQRLKEFRRKTLDLVDQCWPTGAGTIKDVVNYIVDRKN